MVDLRESGGQRRVVPARLGRSRWRLVGPGASSSCSSRQRSWPSGSLIVARTIAAIEANSLGLIDLKSTAGRAGAAGGAVGARWRWVRGRCGWPTAEAGTVARVDPAARRVVQRISVGREPAGVVAGGGAVWVANSGERSLSWINPSTDTVVKRIPVGNGPTGIALGWGGVGGQQPGQLGVADRPGQRRGGGHDPGGGDAQRGRGRPGRGLGDQHQRSTVSRISPSSNTVVRSIPVGNGPRAIAVGADAVWVANGLDGTVSRIDPASDAVVATVGVGDGPSAVAVSPDGVWAASEVRGTVSRLDPDTNTVAGTIRVGSAPAGAAVVDDGLWVTTRGAPTSHRGGTLRLASPARLPPQIDRPAYALYNNDSQEQILLLTNDGLVGFKRVGGVEGSELVANLATSLPRPTAGGTSYTFRLRPDIHYSTGQLVKPEDVRASIERGFKLRSRFHRDFFRGVVGGEACVRRPSDLPSSRRGSSPTLGQHRHLPSHPARSGVPGQAGPVDRVRGARGDARQRCRDQPRPGHRPLHDPDVRPQANRGPGPQPHFREWSRAAQPDGYPDRIEWTPSGQVARIERTRRSTRSWPGGPTTGST